VPWPGWQVHVFFFQAEDGIRDGHVTGVQTCALPISVMYTSCPGSSRSTLLRGTVDRLLPGHDVYITDWRDAKLVPVSAGSFDLRSEERRVGKERRLQGALDGTCEKTACEH